MDAKSYEFLLIYFLILSYAAAVSDLWLAPSASVTFYFSFCRHLMRILPSEFMGLGGGEEAGPMRHLLPWPGTGHGVDAQGTGQCMVATIGDPLRDMKGQGQQQDSF